MTNKKKSKVNCKLKKTQKISKKINFNSKHVPLSKKYLIQSSIDSFIKVTAWLDKQYNLENLKLLADVAAQQDPLLLTTTNLSIEKINKLTDGWDINYSNLKQKKCKLVTG